MRIRYCFTLLIYLPAFLAAAQENIDWKLLSKVRFKTAMTSDCSSARRKATPPMILKSLYCGSNSLTCPILSKKIS